MLLREEWMQLSQKQEMFSTGGLHVGIEFMQDKTCFDMERKMNKMRIFFLTVVFLNYKNDACTL